MEKGTETQFLQPLRGGGVSFSLYLQGAGARVAAQPLAAGISAASVHDEHAVRIC